MAELSSSKPIAALFVEDMAERWIVIECRDSLEKQLMVDLIKRAAEANTAIQEAADLWNAKYAELKAERDRLREMVTHLLNLRAPGHLAVRCHTCDDAVAMEESWLTRGADTSSECHCGCYSGGCGRPDGCRCDKTCPCGAAGRAPGRAIGGS